MSILSVDQIQPIGSGTTITLNATEVKTGTEITVGTGASIFSPAGNTLTLGTNNVERIRIKNDGTVLIGTSTEGISNADDLTVATSGHTGVTIRSGTSNQGNIFFSDGTSGADEYRGYLQYEHTANTLIFGTDAVERLRINSNGMIEMRSDMSSSGQENKNIFRFTDTDAGTTGNQSMGRLQWFSSDTSGAGACVKAEIEALASDTTPDAYMVFKTHNTGTTPTERLRITSNGEIGIAYATPRTKLEVVETHDTTGAGTFTPVLRLSTSSYGTEQGPQLQFGTTNVSYPQWIYGDICAGYEGGSFGGALIFRTNSGSSMAAVSERGRWTRDGHLKIKDGNLIINTAGHGIDFSATGGPTNGSGTSELLEDYEEGTFTPAFSMTSGGHNITYSTQQGSYTKIGNVVSIEIYLTINGINANGSGNLIITGLPFTKTGRYGGLNISYLHSMNNKEIVSCLLDLNNTVAYLYEWNGSSNVTTSVASVFTTSSQLMVNGTYLAA